MRRLQQVDQESGEVLDGVLVYVAPKARIGGWFMAFQDALVAIAKQGLTQTQMRVLMFLFGKLDWENYIAVSQTDIAREIGIDRAEVSKAVKALREAKILLPGPKVGSLQTHRLNPTYGWKGKVRELEKAKRDHLKLVTAPEE